MGEVLKRFLLSTVIMGAVLFSLVILLNPYIGRGYAALRAVRDGFQDIPLPPLLLSYIVVLASIPIISGFFGGVTSGSLWEALGSCLIVTLCSAGVYWVISPTVLRGFLTDIGNVFLLLGAGVVTAMILRRVRRHGLHQTLVKIFEISTNPSKNHAEV